MQAFGIDFGTTNTSVVYCEITEFGITKTVYGENGQPFPSLVALHPEKPPVFAWDVKKRRSQLIAGGYHVVASFKSILGSNQNIEVGSKQYSSVDVTALFLSYVRSRVEGMSKLSLTEAVMAIPVDFSPEQRRNLRDAAGRAGIEVKSFVSEPTAAYVNCRDELAGDSNIAVFDWGGGTLDISLISVENQEVSELGIAGQRLGGNDIDQMIARRLHARIAQEKGDARAFDDLRPEERDQILDRSEDVKKRLSTDDEAPFRLMHYAGQTMIRGTFALDEFSKLIESKINDAEALLHHAAEKAGIGLGQMDAILMVGGSCEMQPVYQRIERIAEEYHLRLCRPEDIQWSVAGGAAVLSAMAPSYRLQQGFGVLLSDDTFYPVFEAGTIAPCQAQELCFGVVTDTTTAIFVFADESHNVFKRISVPIKGFTAEGIHLKCRMDRDMIVHVEIYSDYAQRMAVTAEFNQIGFTYRIK